MTDRIKDALVEIGARKLTAMEAEACRRAQLSAYQDALAMLAHHASLCSEAQSLHMDMDTALRRRIAALEAPALADPKRKGRD